jgi:glyoxylase-like metal-dependent hydrolase (beta-lactamase superfamily II)
MPQVESFFIGRYADQGPSSVNTYWIETARSLIVIDGQRSLSRTHRALAEMQKLRKPIEAIFLTHPHPDHTFRFTPPPRHGTTMPRTGKGSWPSHARC